MEILVGSKNLLSETIVALDVSGREHLVIVTKASWRIPEPGQRPQPITPQPLEQADVYAGEPGESAMLYGSDFARFKPRCDVLFNACAHSPNAQPVSELAAGWRIGTLQKALKVFGPRTWQTRLGFTTLSNPEPFTRMPLHYGLAFGGTRYYQERQGGPRLAQALIENPSGIGWAGHKTRGAIIGEAAPSLELLNEPVQKPDGPHKPAAFSAIARHWAPRRNYAGTYDEQWRQNVFPFLPADFDERYHLCAPEDQQMDYPKGGEDVVMINMMAGRPDVRFQLPALDQLQVRVLRTDYSTETPQALADTLYFEPDAQRFSVVWRASVPIRRRIQEFGTVAVGPVDPAWWEARSLGLDGSGCAGCGNERGSPGV